MTFTKTYNIQENNQLIIQLPNKFKLKRQVRVIIEDVDDEEMEKINLLKQASQDPLFLEDIAETNADFENIDHDLQ
jgi:hypothetical protein